jgi:hypothetical protein
MAEMTYKDISDAIVMHAMKDPAFRKELLSNPTATVEKYSGQPSKVKIFVHENSATQIHFVLPPVVGEGDLSDADLEKVAGGEFFIGVAVVGAIAALGGAGMGIANDQTRARHGW